MDSSQLPWFFAVLGFIILGAAIGYGLSRSRRRSPVERELNAAGTRKIYREEERRPGED